MPEHEIHWTRNEETVDRYLRGGSSEEERSRLLTHLETCAECRERIDGEQRLAGSIREIGRRELKARLNAKLQSRKSQVPWPHVLSAAALLLVVIGVGLYSIWKDRQAVTVTEHGIVSVPQAEAKKPTPSGGASREQEETASREQAKGGAAEGLAGGEEKMERAPRRATAHEDAVAARAEPPAAEQMRMDKHEEQEFWLEGQILTEATAIEGLSAKGVTAAPKAMILKEDDLRKAAQQKNADTESYAPEFSVKQQPLSALPVAIRRQFAPTEGVSIPTMVQSTSTGYSLTLYTDRFTLKDRTPRTMRPVPDSLVIEIDGTRILYQVPPALQSNLNLKGAAKH